MAPHSSTLAWKIPWMEEPGRLQSMGSLRVGHNWATSLSLFTLMHWRRKWQPTPVFLPGESQGRGAWWAAVYGFAQSRTRLKWPSSSMAILSGFEFVLLYAEWENLCDRRDRQKESSKISRLEQAFKCRILLPSREVHCQLLLFWIAVTNKEPGLFYFLSFLLCSDGWGEEKEKRFTVPWKLTM